MTIAMTDAERDHANAVLPPIETLRQRRPVNRSWLVLWYPLDVPTVDRIKVIDAWGGTQGRKEAEKVMRANCAKYRDEHGEGYVKLVESPPAKWGL